MILHAKLLSNTMYVPEGIAPCKEQHLLEKTAFIFIEESLFTDASEGKNAWYVPEGSAPCRG